MPLAIETVGSFITNTVALGPATLSPGDTVQVRNFGASAQAFLEQIIIKGGQATTGQVTSPLFHDNVRGIRVVTAQAPSQYTLSPYAPQPLKAQDVLGLQLNSGGANSSIMALQNYYTDLAGATARLHSWGDVSGLISNIIMLEVDCAASATIGTWSDTGFQVTENLLKANVDYAVLGYQVDVACAVVAIKGADTSNLRIGGPGTTLQDTSVNYFVRQSNDTGRPHIPVFNAANAPATFVSVLDNAAATAVKVQLVCAQLASNLSS